MEEREKSLTIPIKEEKKINKNAMAKAPTLNGEWGNSVQCMLMLGNQLINYIPLEPLTEISENYADELHFKNALYDFYTYCEKGEIIYTETKFIKFFNLHNFKIPASVINFLDYKNSAPTYEYVKKLNFIPFMDVRNIEPDKVVSYVNNDEITICRTYAIDNSIEYYLVIAYELLKHGYRIKRCIECGKWLIVINKIDTLYCDECRTVIKKLQNDMSILKSRYIGRCKKREKSPQKYNTDFPEDKEWYDLEAKITEECYKAKTKAEIKACIEWIKSLKKRFPKAKGD